ncbi:MAG: 5'/3'-nucleotidase SurE [Acidobacteriota bacterium]
MTARNSASRPRILVSNDDGYIAAGLQALAKAMEPLGEVWVVAPEAEQSAASHAISLHRPLRIRQVRSQWLAVDGTPTDCAYLGINHILKGRRPAIMVTGINHGPNMADDVTYSGTVAAAMEASLLGVPAIAFSLVDREGFDFSLAARFAESLVRAALGRSLSPQMLLNVNIPGGVDPEGYVITRLGKHTYGFDVVEKVDPRGRKYYWIGGSEYEHEDFPGSDCNAVLRDRLVSVTPLHLDLTDHEMRESVASWSLDGFQQDSPNDGGPPAP